MDKYAPDLEEKDLEKTAQSGCPRCGKKLNGKSNVPKCEDCGVEPWSKEDKDVDNTGTPES